MPVPKQITHSGQKVCIIGEIQSYVASMLRPKSFYDCRRSLNMSPSLKILRVTGGGIVIGAGDGRLRDLLRKHGPIAFGQFISNCPRLTAVGIACGYAGKK